MSSREIRERNARFMQFVLNYVGEGEDVLGTDGTNLYLIGEGKDFTPITFEDAVFWAMDQLLLKTMNEDVIPVGKVFLVTRKYARRWGLVMPDELEQDPDAKFMLINDPYRKLLSGKHLELLSELLKNEVEIY